MSASDNVATSVATEALLARQSIASVAAAQPSTAVKDSMGQRPQRKAAANTSFIGMDPEDPTMFLQPDVGDEVVKRAARPSRKRKAAAPKAPAVKRARASAAPKQSHGKPRAVRAKKPRPSRQQKLTAQAPEVHHDASETSASDLLSELSIDDDKSSAVELGILAQVQIDASSSVEAEVGGGSESYRAAATVPAAVEPSSSASDETPITTDALSTPPSTAHGSTPSSAIASNAHQSVASQGNTGSTEANGSAQDDQASPVASDPSQGTKPDSEAGSKPAKLEASGRPHATASSRAALAETLPYYRAYQQGAYTGHGMVSGFYLGECTLKRPHFDGDVIITRCGGHHGSVEGSMKQISDVPASDAQVGHFRRNMGTKTPFVAIIGKSNQHCLVALPAEFNVMGWFQVTDIWNELNDGYITYLYRLERVRRSGNGAWWIPKGEQASPDDLPAEEKCSKQSCRKCHHVSKQIYSEGWICLNRDCSWFWKLGNASAASLQLTYAPEFLQERSPFPEGLAFPFDLFPPEPELSANEAAVAGGYDKRMWKGFACAGCKHISPRRKWTEYKCDGCGKTIDLNQPPVSMSIIRSPHALRFTGHAICINTFDPSFIVYSAFALGWFVFRRYDLGHGNSVFHVQSNEVINKSPGGPDDMLLELQTDRTMGLERRSLGNKSGKAEGLVNHFSQNFGFPYKYIVAQMSTAFKDAPQVILRSLDRCQWIAEQALGKDAFDRFNEVLAVGYMEQGSMGYHDDGERELGNTVVAMCIGGDATMKVRMKDEYFKGYLRGGKPVSPSFRVPKGAVMADERRKLNKKYADKPWNKESEAAHRNDFNKLSAKAKASGLKLRGEAKPILEMKFRHGDFFIMNGPDVQTYYEHGVAMDDKLRFALTARHIQPALVDKEYHHLGDRDTSAFKYDGATDGSPLSSARLDLAVGEASTGLAAGLD